MGERVPTLSPYFFISNTLIMAIYEKSPLKYTWEFLNKKINALFSTTDFSTSVRSIVDPLISNVQSATASTIAALAANPVSAPFAGDDYIIVYADSTPAANGQEFFDAYAEAISRGPSLSNRITLVLAPGLYNLPFAFNFTTPFINIVTLDGNKSAIFSGADININSDYHYIKGLVVTGSQRMIMPNSSGLPNTVFELCQGGDDFLTGNGRIQLSTYIDCIGGDYSFNGADVGGTYIRCKAGDSSFGGIGITISTGTFIDCEGGNYCWTDFRGIMRGCVTGNLSPLLIRGDVTYSTLGTFGGQLLLGGLVANTVSEGGMCMQVIGSNSLINNVTSLDTTNQDAFTAPVSAGSKVFRCTKAAGTFNVSGAGQIKLCIDGTGTEINVN